MIFYYRFLLVAMKKILAYLSPEKYASLFDIVVGHDAGADVIVPYCNIAPEDVRDMVHSCIFTRHPKDLSNTAIFIGGHNVNLGEEMLEKAIETFNELPDFFRVSVAVDPDGAYTTACACAVKVKKAMDNNLKGKKAVILAGTGPVGQRVAVLLAKEGCKITLTSRKLERAEETCNLIKEKYGVEVKPMEVRDDDSTETAVSDKDIVIATGPEGIQVLSKSIWSKFPQIRILADVNAVPPAGIEGVGIQDDCKDLEGKVAIGALAIGDLKMKCHHKLVERLFEDNKTIFDLEKVYGITEEMV